MAATDSGFGVAITFQSGFFAQVLSINGFDMTRAAIETTHSTTTGGYATFIPSDIVDHGEYTVEFNLDPDMGSGIPIDQAAETITVTFPTPVGGSSGATWQHSGFMTNFSANIPIDDRMTASATIKISGDITYTDST